MKTLLTVGIALFAAAAMAQTSISPVNIGATPNDGTGDPIRTSFNKLNANDAHLNAGKMENTNPVFSGTITGDTASITTATFGSGGIGMTGGGVINPGTGGFNVSGAGTIIGASHIITGPTHTWKTIEVTPGAAGGAAGTPSMFVVKGTLNTSNAVDSSIYEWMHADGSFSLDKPGSTNKFSGSIGTASFFLLTNQYVRIQPDGGGQFAGGDFAWDVLGNVQAATLSAPWLYGNLTNTSSMSIGSASTMNLFSGADMFINSVNDMSINSGGILYLNGQVTPQLAAASGPNLLIGAINADQAMSAIPSGAGVLTNCPSGNPSFTTTPTLSGLTITGAASIGTNVSKTIYFPTTDGATSWGASTLYTNGPQAGIFRMDISSSSSASGSANQVFFHYTNGLPSSPVGRTRQVYFNLATSTDVRPMQVELDPGATFRIDTITSSGGSISFLNQTISSR